MGVILLNKNEPINAGETLYSFTSRNGAEIIETRLNRDEKGRLYLLCRREDDGGEDAVCLPDLERREEACLAFARAVAESHTHPRVIPELWEEFEP